MLKFLRGIWILLNRVFFNKGFSVEMSTRRMSYEGRHFFGFLTFTTSAGGSKEIMVSVPNRKDIGAFFNVTSNAKGIFKVYEGASVSASGTPYTIYASNRNSTASAPVDVYEDPSVSSYGTLLMDIPVGSVSWKATDGGAEVNKDEYILKSSTDYVLQFVENASGTASIECRFIELDLGEV